MCRSYFMKEEPQVQTMDAMQEGSRWERPPNKGKSTRGKGRVSTHQGACRPNTRLQANLRESLETFWGKNKDRPHTEEQKEGPESKKRLCASFHSHLPMEAYDSLSLYMN